MNSMDMMQNCNILYHPESIVEMQIICLLTIVYYQYLLVGQFPIEFNANSEQSVIIIALFVIHILQLFYWTFRRFDISHNGEIDKFGSRRARRETQLGQFEFFIICIIIGFSLHALILIFPDYW
jgi:hypothetical protein